MATLYYANEQDVRDKLLSDPGTSVVSDALIEEWLEAFEAEVDAILTARKYDTVPATNARDVKMIGDKVSDACAARVYRTRFPGKDE
ncbi:hypothetical protein GF380_02355, partial [Candidatus Uhrbacteria bacterium]|nr:hypothetical protein [Candidatus Uhrbacteria bacterium]